eukprot:6172144-Pleurochrysis_carterae.AAC.1
MPYAHAADHLCKSCNDQLWKGGAPHWARLCALRLLTPLERSASAPCASASASRAAAAASRPTESAAHLFASARGASALLTSLLASALLGGHRSTKRAGTCPCACAWTCPCACACGCACACPCGCAYARPARQGEGS